MKNIISAMCMMLFFGQALSVTASGGIPSVVKQYDLENSVDLFIESDVASLRGKLINYSDILGPLEQGAETVKVIVNLVEPPHIEATTDWGSTHSMSELRGQIAAIQASVLSALSDNDFELRYRFDNQAGFSGEVTPDGLAQLLDNPGVESIEPVYPFELHLKQGISQMNASIPRLKYNGKGVSVAILDSGIDYTHPKLGGSISMYDFPNDKVIGGYDVNDNDPYPFPEGSDHGTACAGIVAGILPALTEDNGDFIGGVAHGARLYALRVLTSGTMVGAEVGLNDTLIHAINWCITNKNSDPNYPILAISMSLGNRGRYTSPCDCLEETEDFESGDFLKLPWDPNGYRELGQSWPPWEIDSNYTNEGVYSAKAGRPGFGKFSMLRIVVDCAEGDITFYRKISSSPVESGGTDHLAFYIDGIMKNSWKGEMDWGQSPRYRVTEGLHVFWWVYFNKYYGSGGADTVWIDDITFPVRCPSALSEATENAVHSGITILASSGNQGYCDSIPSPAALSNVISVGAVYDAAYSKDYRPCVTMESCAPTRTYSLGCSTRYYAVDHPLPNIVTSYSNSASILDILAPSNSASTTTIDGSMINNFGGTSAACPYAAGAVACLQQAAYENMGRYLLPSEVKNILTATGDLVTDAKAPDITKPRVNLGWAIDSLPGLAASAEKFNESFVFFESDWTLDSGAAMPYEEPRGLVLKLKSGSLAILKDPIDLSSQTRAVLTYLYKRTGGGDSPSADKDLVLEYDDGQRWVELDRRDSDRPDMNDYGFAIARVPDEALSSEFKMRIRCEGSTDEEQGDWFVDDIVIKGWTLVFEDSFPVTDVNEEKWPINDAIVDDLGQGKPSLPYSLHFNGRASAESKTIDLSSYSGAVLTFHYQRNVYNTSRPLLVEYYSGSNWEELARLPGRAPGMTEYHRDMRYLPSEALQTGFKFRIRSEDSLLNALDDWFVDDVTIEAW